MKGEIQGMGLLSVRLSVASTLLFAR